MANTLRCPRPLLTAAPRPHARARAGIALAAVLIAFAWLAAPAGAVTPSPSSYDWGTVDFHQPPAPPPTFVITNTDPADATVAAAGINGADAGQFSIVSDGCSGVTLSQNQSCNVQVAFTPNSPGAKSAQLVVPSPGSGDADVTLSGNAATGTLQSSPDPITFSPQPWYYGSPQTSAYIQVLDYGVQFGSLSITGADAAFFSLSYDQCSHQMFQAPSGCNVGVQFNPTGPGTKTAQLVVPSDSGGSPLVVPISATALAGAIAQITPSPGEFGDVAVGGAAAARPFTLRNTGDSPLQISQMLIVGAAPQSFPLSADTCTARTLAPGDTCTFAIGFTPTRVGPADASILLLYNGPVPLASFGIGGNGVAPPAGAAVVQGTQRSGSRLLCAPQGFDASAELAFSWLRDQTTVAGGAVYVPSDRDIGHALRCRIVASNVVGTATATSAPTGPIGPRLLTGLAGSFAGEKTCRTVQSPARLRVGDHTAILGGGRPTIAQDPLAVSVPGARGVRVSINGRVVATGAGRATVPPRTLSAFGDGRVTLGVSAAGATAETPVALAPCRLAARVVGGRGQTAALRVAAATGIGALRISLPGSMRLHAARRTLGYAYLAVAGIPPQTFPLYGRVTRANDTTITLGAHGAIVRGLPANTGVVSLFLRPGVITGRAGPIMATAPLLGGGTGRATSAAWWRPAFRG